MPLKNHRSRTDHVWPRRRDAVRAQRRRRSAGLSDRPLRIERHTSAIVWSRRGHCRRVRSPTNSKKATRRICAHARGRAATLAERWTRSKDRRHRSQPFVRCYVQLDIRLSGQPVLLPIPARSAAILEFTLGDPHEVLFTEGPRREVAHPCNVVGVQTYRRVQLSMRGQPRHVRRPVSTGRVSALLSVPVDTLTNRHFDGRDVCGAWVDDLGIGWAHRPRLRSASGTPTSACCCDALRRAHMRASRRRARCSSEKGNLRISGLVEQSGLSARQFERRFAAHVGMSPKRYARVVRFEAALNRKKQAPGLRWTEVAHELGYHDQMHMVHDFSLLAGATPSSRRAGGRRHRPERRRPRGRDRPAAGPRSIHPLLT